MSVLRFIGFLPVLFILPIITPLSYGYSAVTAGGGYVSSQPAYLNSVKPAIFYHELRPGGSAADGIMVTNLTGTHTGISLYGTENFSPAFKPPASPAAESPAAESPAATEEAQKSFKSAGESMESIGAWIFFEEEQYELEKDATRVIPFTVRVPIEAAEGVYQGGIATARLIENSLGSLNYSLRTVIPMEIVVTADPQNVTYEPKFTSAAEIRPTMFFYVTIGVFLACLIYIAINVFLNRKHQKTPRRRH